MPTKKPRFIVTIEPDHFRALKALAGFTGQTISEIVSEVLEPRLRPFLAAAQRIESDPRQADILQSLETAATALNAIFGAPSDANDRGGEPSPPETPPESPSKPSRGRVGSRRSAKPREQDKAK